MIIPKVLENNPPPSYEESLLKLLESIAEEELALANLISSEADKISAFTGKNFDFPTNPTTSQILHFNKSIHKIVESVMMKEWLLLRKLETVLAMNEKLHVTQHNLDFEQLDFEFEEE